MNTSQSPEQNPTHPFLTILLPVYNGESYLREAVNSILAQDFTDFELLIIDDGSTDRSAEIIQSINDQRIHYVRNENNLGLIATLNKGLSLAHAPWIGRIDADDIWDNPRKISKQIEYIRAHPNTVLLGTWAQAIDEHGKDLFIMKYPSNDIDIRKKMLSGNQFIHPSVIFRAETARNSGGFNKDEKYMEDFGLWLRMGKMGTIANIPEVLMKYRIHGAGISQSNSINQIKNSLILIKKHRDSYPYLGYIIGTLKWNIKLMILRIFGLKSFNALKNLKEN